MRQSWQGGLEHGNAATGSKMTRIWEKDVPISVGHDVAVMPGCTQWTTVQEGRVITGIPPVLMPETHSYGVSQLLLKIT